MNRLMQWVIAATLICGATVFTSCSKDDNPVNPADNLAEKIIGKWMTEDSHDHTAPTNKKIVITFVSATKAYVSRSREAKNSESKASTKDSTKSKHRGARWDDYTECDVKIEGNTVLLTSDGTTGSKISTKYQIESISQTEFVCKVIHDTSDDKPNTSSDEEKKEKKKKDSNKDQRFVRITRDYSEAVLGLWECKGLKGDETFNDANARLEFYEDGTYNYWRKNETGEWESVTSTREFQEYFVDGKLLCTRWKNIDEDELREWWEIAYIKDGKMQWEALRQNEDRTTFEQVMDWEKVEE